MAINNLKEHFQNSISFSKSVQNYCNLSMELKFVPGAIHLTKISGNSGTKSNGTERFWKFVLKIVDNLWRLSFFLEIWKFQKFPVPFGISTRFESIPVPSVVKAKRWRQVSLSSRHYTGCKMICHGLNLFLIKNENIRI